MVTVTASLGVHVTVFIEICVYLLFCIFWFVFCIAAICQNNSNNSCGSCTYQGYLVSVLCLFYFVSVFYFFFFFFSLLEI